MIKRNFLVVVIAILLLIFLRSNEPAIAQTSTNFLTNNVKKCIDGDLSAYERWITDMPCASVLFSPEGGILPSETEIDPTNPKWDEPDIENVIDLAFSSYRDGNWEIYLHGYPWSRFDTQSATRQTNDPSADILPRIRPGSLEIVYSSNRNGNYDLFSTYGPDGIDQPLTSNPSYDSQASWSPDGVNLAFVSDRDGNLELYRMLGDGTGLIRLTYSSADDFMPSWSPDGSQIIWVKAVDQQNGVIYAMDSDGANPHPISPPLRFLQHPHYSGNAALINFDYDANLDGWNDIGVMNNDGSNLHSVKLGQYLVDYWAGSWVNILYRDFTFSRINYIVYQDQLYIESMCVGTYDLTFNGAPCMSNSTLDTYPDSNVIDISIPVTNVLPLPQYTRAGMFPVTVVGSDPGLAGLFSISIQYLIGQNGVWTDWVPSYQKTSETFSYDGQPGNPVFFRTQGRDWANHYELWPEGNGDTYTYIYAWQLEGQITDTRGIAIPNVSVITTPVYSDQIDSDKTGKFHRFVPTTAVDVNIQKNGYAQLPMTMIASEEDTQYNFVLPPEDELIENGNFDEDLTDWISDGNKIPSQNLDVKHSGDASVSFNPVEIFNTSEFPFINSNRSVKPRIISDSQGTLHLVWSELGDASVNDISYSQKTITGGWTDPIVVNPVHTYSSYIPEIALGPDEGLHVVWLDDAGYAGTSNISYAFRSPDGIWSEVVDLPGPNYIWSPVENSRPEIAVDSQNTVHIVYGDQSGLWYINKPASGTWSVPLNISYYFSPHEICIGPDDTLHVGYLENQGVYYKSRSVDGVWSYPETIFTGYVYHLESTMDDFGIFYLTWRSAGEISYAERSPSGQWSSTIRINVDDGVYVHEIVTDNNRAYILWYGTEGLKFRYQFEDNTWSSIINLSSGHITNELDFSVSDDHVQAIWAQGEDWNTRDLVFSEWDIPQTVFGSLTQTITLPNTLHNPTLSFVYQSIDTGSDGTFSLEINDEIVFSTSENTLAWTHQWIDLSRWLGQEIEVKFSLQNDQSHGTLIAYLDEVSIGSWLTPLIYSVEPGQIDAETSITITIVGENFLDTPSVRINELTFEMIELIDEHTIRCKIPEGLPVGIYDIWVVNPNGQEGFKVNALRVGLPVFMPIIQK